MIVFDRKEKEIKVPEGLGNINLTVVDANLEDKTVEINEVETTILPSSGYNGMSSLQIDAQPVYDNGYNEGENIGYNSGYTAGDIDGYNRGYNEGETDQKAKLTGITITENGTYSREDGYNEITVDVPDLNGDYNEGYDAGKVDGYDSGYTAGETEQKSKLTNITISENGTYTREDGYNTVVVDVPDTNGSYDEGYQAGIDYAAGNAEEIAAANAIDLVATEFDTYYTIYSDNIDNVYPEVTGVFPNGKNFYNYSTGKYYYNTGLQTSTTTKIEIWFYNDGVNTVQSYYFKTTQGENYNFALFNKQYNEGWRASIGANKIDFTLEVGWQHLAMSFANGLVVNGEKIGDFNGNIIGASNIEIGENVLTYTPTHTIGMIKIDGYVIIPTADGLLNTTTNQLLEKNGDGVTYKYIDNTPIVLDNLIKTVNVQPKVNVAKYGLRFGQSTFKEIPEWANFTDVTDMSHIFDSCGSLQTIPELDTLKVTNMSYMFNGCGVLQTIPLLNTSNVTNMNNMFQDCSSLQTIPLLNTSNVTNMSNMFQDCSSLQTIPLLNTSNVTNMNYMFNNCKNLQTIPELDTRNVTNMGYMLYGGYNGMSFITLPKIYCDSCTNITRHLSATDVPTLTEVGGWINLKIDWNDNYGLVRCPNLTYQSCINILNGLADVTELGSRTLKVHPNFLTTVGDEISIGTNKNWTITA